MSLRPQKTIQKALLSTSSRFVGEYERDGVLLTHAFPDFYDTQGLMRFQEGPASRNAFVFAFETRSEEETTSSDFSHVGDLIASYLSVLFGKRFDHHGLIESSGLFRIPELSHFDVLCRPNLPHNSQKPRADYSAPLDLKEFARLEPLVLGSAISERVARTFRGAAKFYVQALQNFERDPEIAYLHLITAGEVLSDFHTFDKDSLLDGQTKKLLHAIRAGFTGGDSIANQISDKLLTIKRRFVKTIAGLVDPGFFQRCESPNVHLSLKSDTFEKSVGAAYDMRSKYVHAGVPFGRWVAAHGPNAEVQIGEPVIADKELRKVIHRAPTLVGLERICRYALLRFAEAHGAYQEPSVAAASSPSEKVTKNGDAGN